MNFYPINVLLADDDCDDCLLFKEALDELPISTTLTTVNNGAELMEFLTKKIVALPDVLFLDLNMPRKNGFECLTELKQQEKFNNLPVIIYSTSFDHEIINLLYKKGATFYIRKPAEFSTLKQIIHTAIKQAMDTFSLQPGKEKFILQL